MYGPCDVNAAVSTLPKPGVTLQAAGFGLIHLYLLAEGGKAPPPILRNVKHH